MPRRTPSPDIASAIASQLAGGRTEIQNIRVIQSQPSRQSDEGQTVRCRLDPALESADAYPLVTLTREGAPVTYPRRGRSKVRGHGVEPFYRLLKRTLRGVSVSMECHLAVPCTVMPIEPAIILFDLQHNLLVDVEIDAPYDGVYRFGTHCADDGSDTRRDRYLSQIGWNVVRFSEQQICQQPDTCAAWLQYFVDSAQGIVKEAPMVSADSRWTAVEAMRWESERHRETLWKVPSFEPYDFEYRVRVGDPSEEDIVFDEASHIYAPRGNQSGTADYTSVTTLIGRFFPVDGESVVMRKAQKEHRDEEEVRAELEALRTDASDRGTELHAAIEHYLKREEWPEYGGKEFEYFLQFHKDKVEPGLEFVAAEKMISLPEYRVAGTVDALFRRKRDGAYIMVDWKRSKHLIVGKGKVRKYGFGRGLSILSHLDNSSYYQYELQQSFYKYILEKQYGIHVEHMMLCVLHPDYSQYHTIRLETYREREVKAMLGTMLLRQ